MGLFPAGDLGLKIGKATWVEISGAFHDLPTRFFSFPKIEHAVPPLVLPIHLIGIVEKSNTFENSFLRKKVTRLALKPSD